MRCDEAQELITARVDGELSADEQLAIEAHLKICGPCREAFTAESYLKQQTKLAGRGITAPASLRQAIEGRIAGGRPIFIGRSSESVRRWFDISGWRPAFAVALLLLAVASVIYMTMAFAKHRPCSIGDAREYPQWQYCSRPVWRSCGNERRAGPGSG